MKNVLILLSLLLILPVFCVAQEKTESVSFDILNFFVGEWLGEETGKAGIGKGEREYSFILKNKYLFVNNKSVFEPQEKNPEGEIHVDQGYFSFDNFRNLIVLREFHGEGFVIQYTLDSLSEDKKTMIFLSEAMENAPDGTRARQTFRIQNDNQFNEVFELAFQGKEFSVFLENRWTRKE